MHIQGFSLPPFTLGRLSSQTSGNQGFDAHKLNTSPLVPDDIPRMPLSIRPPMFRNSREPAKNFEGHTISPIMHAELKAFETHSSAHSPDGQIACPDSKEVLTFWNSLKHEINIPKKREKIDELQNRNAFINDYPDNNKIIDDIHCYEFAISCDPTNRNHFLGLAKVNEVKSSKIQAYGTIISRFGRQNKELAHELYVGLCKLCDLDDPSPHLIYLSALEREKDVKEIVRTFRILASVYKERNEEPQYLYYLSKLIQFKKDKDFKVYCQALSHCGQIVNAHSIYNEWAHALLEKGKWSKVLNMHLFLTSNEISESFHECKYAAAQHVSGEKEKCEAYNLGNVYELQKKVVKAIELYSRLQAKFQDYTSAKRLGRLFVSINRDQSLHYYTIAYSKAMQERDFPKMNKIYYEAVKLDPLLAL